MSELLDTRFIVARRLELGLSQREVAHGIGLTGQAYARIEEGNHAALTLLAVIRLADALAVERGRLLKEEQGHEHALAEASDAARLEAALTLSAAGLRRDDIASILSWPLRRVDSASSALRRELCGRALVVHRAPRGQRLRLVPRAELLSSDERASIARVRIQRQRLTIRQARILRALRDGDLDSRWEQHTSSRDRVDLAALMNAGLVERRQSRITLTSGASFSLE